MDFAKEIEMLKGELISLRRDFHENPELGFQEYRTSDIIVSYLKTCGLEVKKGVAKTGVVGLLRGEQPGPTVIIRSDMDAIPVYEETGLSFKSKNEGVMHACGHDGHVAMLLIAAKILAKYKKEIKGNIKFVFQPNEEDAGAEIMLNEGVLENPSVEAAFGMHLWSLLETGEIGIMAGPIMASSYYFKLDIQGKGGHGGAPHMSINPINCAVSIIQSVKTMQADEVDPMKPTVITFCKMNGGSSPTIIPEKIEIEGSIRCLHEDIEEIQCRFEEIIRSICDANKATYELGFKCGNDLLKNDEAMSEIAKKAGVEVVGKANIIDSNISVMLGEDFAEFSKRVPSVFCFIGTANKEKKSDYPHHHSRFNIDEDSMLIGVEMHIRSVLEYLNSYKA